MNTLVVLVAFGFLPFDGFNEIRPHDCRFVPSTLGAEPLALGFVCERHTVKVEPLDDAAVVVAADHLAVGHLVTQTVRGLVGVDGGVDGRLVSTFVLLRLTLLLLLGLVFVLILRVVRNAGCEK